MITIIDGGLLARYMGMPDMKAQHTTLALEGTNPISKFSYLSSYRPQGPIRARTRRTCDDEASIISPSASTTLRLPLHTLWLMA